MDIRNMKKPISDLTLFVWWRGGYKYLLPTTKTAFKVIPLK